jgi:hypothetical protein
MLEATEEDVALASRLAALRERMNDLEAQKQELEAHFKGRIMGTSGIEGIASWKKAKDTLATDWKAVAMELNPPLDIVQKHTATKEGSRRFLFKFKFREAV